MSSNAKRRIEEAREAADFLASIGEHKRAECVRSVCRANSSYAVTLAQLHGDNAGLRAQLQEG